MVQYHLQKFTVVFKQTRGGVITQFETEVVKNQKDTK